MDCLSHHGMIKALNTARGSSAGNGATFGSIWLQKMMKKMARNRTFMTILLLGRREDE